MVYTGNAPVFEHNQHRLWAHRKYLGTDHGTELGPNTGYKWKSHWGCSPPARAVLISVTITLEMDLLLETAWLIKPYMYQSTLGNCIGQGL